MRHLRAWFVVFPCLAILALGCSKPSADPIDGNLVLVLPESAAPPDHDKSRVSKLSVNGKDYSEPRSTKRTLQVQSAAGSDEVTIEFSYWPNTYTNIIRTKVVKLAKDKTVSADLTKEDPAMPDLIKPIYVPTPKQVVAEMCRMAKLGSDDIVYDIGCGEGLMVLQAVKEFGAKKGVGIDIDAGLIAKCLEHRKKDGLDDKVEFRAANALEIKDFSEATVVLLYLGDFLNHKLKPVLRETLKPGARVVSHRFLMGDDWPPDETRTINAINNYDTQEEYKLHIWHIKKK